VQESSPRSEEIGKKEGGLEIDRGPAHGTTIKSKGKQRSRKEEENPNKEGTNVTFQRGKGEKKEYGEIYPLKERKVERRIN